jgi:hypothetical protein
MTYTHPGRNVKPRYGWCSQMEDPLLKRIAQGDPDVEDEKKKLRAHVKSTSYPRGRALLESLPAGKATPRATRRRNFATKDAM